MSNNRSIKDDMSEVAAKLSEGGKEAFKNVKKFASAAAKGGSQVPGEVEPPLRSSEVIESMPEEVKKDAKKYGQAVTQSLDKQVSKVAQKVQNTKGGPTVDATAPTSSATTTRLTRSSGGSL